MSEEKPFKPGIVEGFFGNPWSWQAREDYASFLRDHGFGLYLYAPKSDASLRKNWQSTFDSKHFQRLQKLSSHYLETGIDFGIGLSPYELYRNFDSNNKNLLSLKLQEINRINPEHLSILFDDMPGDFNQLAEQQTEILNFILDNSTANSFSICPTYYSLDPNLERIFGCKPEHYLEKLGNLVPPQVDILWTGEKVISDSYSENHLNTISQILNRKPVIWDNYPVNDSKLLSPFLNLKPFSNRGTLPAHSAGHLANPMNQPYLSQIPLLTLTMAYQNNNQADEKQIFQQAVEQLCSPALQQALLEDYTAFQTIGLDDLSSIQKADLVIKYSQFESPVGKEIIDWLLGAYAFDPDCLTM